MLDQRQVAIALMQQKKFSEALPIFLSLMESNSDDWGLYYMTGQCLRFINNIPEAIRYLNKAASLNPNNATIFLALGIALQLAEEYELAIEKLKRAVRLEPVLFEAYNSIGFTYRKIGQYREALGWYSKAAEVFVDSVFDDVKKDKEGCFREEIVNGEKTLVILPYTMEKTHEMLRSNPVYAIIMNNIGVCLIKLGDIDSAREKFRESIEFIPDGFDYPDPFKNLESIG
jgi:tetratricopeptide (TPR) repeat protein